MCSKVRAAELMLRDQCSLVLWISESEQMSLILPFKSSSNMTAVKLGRFSALLYCREAVAHSIYLDRSQDPHQGKYPLHDFKAAVIEL